ncbi:phosducin-like protein [Ptychodera flava]|uniref:phosducin-like protein n=1 Tax=Ptychodera flava TaxID=63121 RepID=UPI00396A1F3C
MATLEDRILGEKTQYYCSSSEDEEEEDARQGAIRGQNEPEPDADYSGSATHTGPKGVLEDWRRYKQLENENRKEQEKEKLLLAKKLAATCRTSRDDDREKETEEQQLLELEAELEDEFLHRYRLQRMEEMQRQLQNKPMFGRVIELRREEFLDAIDRERPQVTVIIHIYEEGVPGCDAVNGCMQCLSVEYPRVKFCAIKSSETPVSTKFTQQGLPAILVYKQGTLIGNFVKVSNHLGHDFFAGDLENFLQEHGILPRKDEEVSSIIRDSSQRDEEEDSDLELD